jgi:hypothetical protein
MELARLWREHLEAGYPPELVGMEIAGTDARALDAEITACVSAFLTNQLVVDERIENRLEEVRSALDVASREGRPSFVAYAHRLNELVSAVLIETRVGRG